MNLDIRYPIGLMFSIFGAILGIFGLVTNHSEMYVRSLGYNVNLLWGVVLLVFGASMLLLAYRAKHRKS